MKTTYRLALFAAFFSFVCLSRAGGVPAPEPHPTSVRFEDQECALFRRNLVGNAIWVCYKVIGEQSYVYVTSANGSHLVYVVQKTETLEPPDVEKLLRQLSLEYVGRIDTIFSHGTGSWDFTAESHRPPFEQKLEMEAVFSTESEQILSLTSCSDLLKFTATFP